ncbi:MAG: hypothetical protein M1826_002175 [Phylliscum demangeonii]|nr:MAG: hypothetical protein M1826_002175 [Phylliscum demangeonii]
MIENDNPYLSSILFRLLGLSVILSRKLVRARKFRKLDTTRDTKSLQLYHQIIWLSKEGLIMVEQYVLPMVANYHNELKVLSLKLRASFYHIFVLFHNFPAATQAGIPGLPRVQSPTAADIRTRGRSLSEGVSGADSPNPLMNGGPVGGTTLPPGLTAISVPKPTGTFLLPAKNYIPDASACFEEALHAADLLLAGSHPVRLSVKLEYAAFMIDCLNDGEASRKIAKRAINDAYKSEEDIDDESFQDAAKLVGTLVRMMRRGQASTTPGSTPREDSSSTPGSQATVKAGDASLPPAHPPSPGNTFQPGIQG